MKTRSQTTLSQRPGLGLCALMASTPAELAPEQQVLLERVAAAARRPEVAEDRYRREMLSAREAGCTLAALATAAEVTAEPARRYIARRAAV